MTPRMRMQALERYGRAMNMGPATSTPNALPANTKPNFKTPKARVISGPSSSMKAPSPPRGEYGRASAPAGTKRFKNLPNVFINK